jgi:hypothetical protein
MPQTSILKWSLPAWPRSAVNCIVPPASKQPTTQRGTGLFLATLSPHRKETVGLKIWAKRDCEVYFNVLCKIHTERSRVPVGNWWRATSAVSPTLATIFWSQARTQTDAPHWCDSVFFGYRPGKAENPDIPAKMLALNGIEPKGRVPQAEDQ